MLAAGGAGMAGRGADVLGRARLPAEKRGLATGIVNAGGSFGQFVMAPIAGALIVSLGWASAMQVLGLIPAIVPLALVLRGLIRRPAGQRPGAEGRGHTPCARRCAIRASCCSAPASSSAASMSPFRDALAGRGRLCGLPPAVGAWALAMIGLFNIVGSVAMGWAVGRWRMKSLLSLLYAARALAVLVFLLAPKTARRVIFAAVMGLTFFPRCRPPPGWSPSSSACATWPRCSASSCCRTRSAAFSAPGSAARCSRPPAATTGSGTSTSCSPWARR